jgi:cell division protein FtsQ
MKRPSLPWSRPAQPARRYAGTANASSREHRETAVPQARSARTATLDRSGTSRVADRPKPADRPEPTTSTARRFRPVTTRAATAERGTSRRMPPRGRLPRLVQIAIALAVVLGLAWVVLLSPLTRIKHIRVDGVAGVVEDSARARATGLRGQPLLLTRLGGVEAAIEQDRRVAGASLERRFPNSLIVHVAPRIPIIAFEKSEGQVELVDIEGVRFENVAAPPAGIAVVKPAAGEQTSDRALRVAIDVVQAMPDQLRGTVTDLQVTNAELVTFKVGETSVVWGDADRVELKAKLVSILLQQNPKTIDISAPDTPVTT